MKFQTQCRIPTAPFLIGYTDSIISMGSCFAENIGLRMQGLGLRGMVNPLGIMYNPISIVQALSLIREAEIIPSEDLFFSKGRFRHWDVHSQVSFASKELLERELERIIAQGRDSYQRSRVLLLTLGSAYAWRKKEDNQIVANCHQMPQSLFQRELLSIGDMQEALKQEIDEYCRRSPKNKVIVTVSPVRYLRDGLINSNRSKARLLEVTHQLTEKSDQVYYFPAYELVTDELRDYRFYKEDMVHPSDQAISFVWNKFIETCFDEQAKQFCKESQQLLRMRGHHLQYPESEDAQRFADLYVRKQQEWKHKFPM